MGVSLSQVVQEILDYPIAPLRVLGPPGSGKTALLLERYRRLNAQLNRAPGSVLIVTYSRERFESLTAAILPPGTGRLGSFPVYTYHRMAKEVLSATGAAPSRIVEEMEELVLLDRVLSRMGNRFRSDYRTVLRSEEFHRLLLEVVHLFLQNGIDREDLRKIEGIPRLEDRLADILAIYGEFLDLTHRRGFTSYYDVSWRAARALRDHPERNPFKDTRILLIDDFQDVDPGQFALLETIAPPSGNTVWNVFGDPMTAYFGFRGTQHRFLMEEFPKRYPCRTVHLPAACQAPRLLGGVFASLLGEVVGEAASNHLPVTLSRVQAEAATSPLSHAIDSKRYSLRFSYAGDEFEEAHTVAARVGELIQSGLKPCDIAIVAREKSQYEAVLSAVFQQHGVALETGRRGHDAFRCFLYDLLKLIVSSEDETTIESLRMSPLFPAFEEVCRQRIEALVTDEDEEDSIASLVALVNGVAEDVVSSRPAHWMKSLFGCYIRPALRAAGAIGVKPSMYASMSSLLSSWDRYATATTKTGGQLRRASIGDFLNKCALFRDTPSATSPGPGLAGLYSCHELKGRQFRVVFLVGCSEMIFPAIQSGEGVIPYGALARVLDGASRARRIEVYQARSLECHFRDEFALLYLALTRAREALYITAPRVFGGREVPGATAIVRDNLPSEIVVDDLIPVDSSRRSERGEAAEGSPVDLEAEASAKTPDSAPPAIRFARHLVGISGGEPLQSEPALARLVEASGPVPGLWLQPAPETRAFRIERRAISPSSIQTYDICKRRYFYRKVLGLPEDETVHAKLGTLYHAVLKKLGEQFPSMRSLHAGATPEHVAAVVGEVLSERGSLGNRSPMERSMRFHLKTMVDRFLEADRRRVDDYRIASIEQMFHFLYKDYEFTGRIDRLDESRDHRWVIVDYKTGGKFDKTARKLRERILESASDPERRDWQVPIYSYGVRRLKETAPLIFSYYRIPSDEDAVVISLLINGVENGGDSPTAFDKTPKSRFDRLSALEIEHCMEEAARIAEVMFAPTAVFERTGDEERCTHCSYRKLCGRGEGWS